MVIQYEGAVVDWQPNGDAIIRDLSGKPSITVHECGDLVHQQRLVDAIAPRRHHGSKTPLLREVGGGRRVARIKR